MVAGSTPEGRALRAAISECCQNGKRSFDNMSSGWSQVARRKVVPCGPRLASVVKTKKI